MNHRNTRQRNVTNATVTVRTPAAARPVLTRSVTVVTPNSIRRARRRPRRTGSRVAASRNTLFMDYVNTLRDPFEYPGVRIGFGTMVPTSLYTAYFRSSLSANADGTFSLVQLPFLGTGTSSLFYNNSGYGTTTWNGLAYSNVGTLSGVMTECRIVSGGIRVVPQIAATAPPGVGYVGSLPSLNFPTLTGSAASSLLTSPHLIMGRAAEGACALVRSVDPYSFTFTVTNVSGSASQNAYSSSPCIVLTGLPASCTILVEAILNVESISGFQTAGQALTNPEIVPNNRSTLADVYSNVEQLVRAASQYIPTGAQINTAASLMRMAGSVGRRIENVMRPRTALSAYSGFRIEEVD